MQTYTVLTDLRLFFGTVLLSVGALLPIVDPLGNAPIYLIATTDLRPEQRGLLAKRVAINCFMLLLASALVGAYVLDFFGVSIPAVQVAGGVMVCAIAWSLLNNPNAPATLNQTTSPEISNEHLIERAFYPLTMPLTVGPGSISVAITLGANPDPGVRALVVTTLGHVVGIFIITVAIYLCYRYAEPILRKLGSTGTGILVRLSAFILLCIGVQICWNGIHGLVVGAFPGLAIP
jgi:multiple antibiotic resistance protein